MSTAADIHAVVVVVDSRWRCPPRTDQQIAATLGRTVEFDEALYVDLDQFGVVVGIELLDLATSLPLDELGARFHINASALDVLTEAIQWGAPRRNVTSGSR